MTLFRGSGSKENIPPIKSSRNSLYVYFTSNGNTAKSGFSATYYTNSVGKYFNHLSTYSKPVYFNHLSIYSKSVYFRHFNLSTDFNMSNTPCVTSRARTT